MFGDLIVNLCGHRIGQFASYIAFKMLIISISRDVTSIEIKDVRAALQQRPELDVFSNEGLGLDIDK